MTDYAFQILDYPGSTETILAGINNSGEVVGRYADSSGTFQGFSETGGVFTKVGYPNTQYATYITFPNGVNANGDIVGRVFVGNSSNGFLDKAGSFSQIKMPGADDTIATGINQNGEIVGDYITNGGNTSTAFYSTGGGLTSLDVPNATNSYANGVNDAGDIAGTYFTSDGNEHGFVDAAGTFVTLDVPNAKATIAEGINNNGAIAGTYISADGTTHGFVYSNDIYTTVDIQGVNIEVAGINDAGQLVGYANTSDGRDGFIATPVCFAAGTAIRTTRGDVAVEALAIGDRVVTASGALRSVRWLGHRAIDCRSVGAAKALPIRVVAHAFGPGLPVRDLFLSPGHPVLVGADEAGAGGHLVPIMCLVNGTTIERMKVDCITYWHVELDQHDILLAEGLPAESYLDWGDRAFFTEGSDHALHNPDLVVPGLAGRCRPVAIDGPVVEAERARLDTVLAQRLTAMSGWPTDTGMSLGF